MDYFSNSVLGTSDLDEVNTYKVFPVLAVYIFKTCIRFLFMLIHMKAFKNFSINYPNLLEYIRNCIQV